MRSTQCSRDTIARSWNEKRHFDTFVRAENERGAHAVPHLLSLAVVNGAWAALFGAIDHHRGGRVGGVGIETGFGVRFSSNF